MYAKILLTIFLVQCTAPCLAQFDDVDSEPDQFEDNTQTTTEGPETTPSAEGNDDDILDDDNPGDDEFPEGFKVVDGIVMDVTNVLIQEVTKNATLYRMYDNSSSQNEEMEEIVFQRPKHEAGWHFIIFEDPDEVPGFGHQILLQKLLGFTVNDTDNFRLYEAFHVDLRDEFAESKDDDKEYKRLLEDFQSEDNERKRNMTEMFSNDSSEYEEGEDTASESPDNEFQNPIEQDTEEGLSSVPRNKFRNNNRNYQAPDIPVEQNPSMPTFIKRPLSVPPNHNRHNRNYQAPDIPGERNRRMSTSRQRPPNVSPNHNRNYQAPVIPGERNRRMPTTRLRPLNVPKRAIYKSVGHSTGRRNLKKHARHEDEESPEINDMPTTDSFFFNTEIRRNNSKSRKRVDQNPLSKSSSKNSNTKSLLEDFSDETTVESITEKHPKQPLNIVSRTDTKPKFYWDPYGKPGGYSLDNFPDKILPYRRPMEPALSDEYGSTSPSQSRSHKAPLYKAMNRRK